LKVLHSDRDGMTGRMSRICFNQDEINCIWADSIFVIWDEINPGYGAEVRLLNDDLVLTRISATGI